MRQKFELRAILGMLIWIGLIAVAIIFARHSFQRAPAATSQLSQYITQERQKITIELDSLQMMRIGDLVYLSESEQVSPIGTVTRIVSDKETEQESVYSRTWKWIGIGNQEAAKQRKIVRYANKAEITFFGTAPQLDSNDRLEYHNAPDSTAWVLQTMLHDEKRKEISKLIMDAFRQNQADIVDAFKPVVKASLKEASGLIKQDIEKAFKAREDQLKKIGEHYQSEIVEKELVPLIKDQIWPIVEEESRPLAEMVGQKIWKEVSVFRFGWRYLYDKTPLPDQKLTQKEFKRFVDGKVVPILESHIGDFVSLQKNILQRVSANEKVKAKLAETARTVASDPAVKQLVSEVLQEVFIENDRLQGVLRERWTGPEAQHALNLANQRLEPTINEIGASLFGSPDTKITPEFARVLRHRILHKDSRWFMLVKNEKNSDTLPTGDAPSSLPVRVVTSYTTAPYAPARDRN
jgi:hypothetical protein